MNLRQLRLAVVLGARLLTAPIYAATQADYLVERVKYSVVTPQADKPLMMQLPVLADKVIEIDGVVSGIVVNGTTDTGAYSGYLLKPDADQTVALVADPHDPDIAVGNKLRVLARVPASGSVLTALAEMRMDEASDPSPANPSKASGSMLDQQFTKAIPPKDFVKQAQQAKPAAKTSSRSQRKRTLAKATRNSQPAPVSSQVQMYAQKIRQYNKNINASTAGKIAWHVLDKSRKYGMDPRLVFALIAQESRFNPRAVSPVGAQGLGQLMPGTAGMLGVSQPFDIGQNVDGTVRYLAQQMQSFGGDLRRALAAYNAGPGNVQRYGGIPPFRETQNYVRVISTHYRQLVNSLL